MKVLAGMISGYIITIFLVAGLLAANKQEVTFINSTPGSIIGLVKFEVNEKGDPIGYTILNSQWTSKRKTIILEPGLYGATKYEPIFDAILDYRQFWVKNKPIIINM